MRICFRRDEDPRDPREIAKVCDDNKIAVAQKVMRILDEAPEVEVVDMIASLDEEGVIVRATVTLEQWAGSILLDRSELGFCGKHLCPDGHCIKRLYQAVLDGVEVRTYLDRHFPA